MQGAELGPGETMLVAVETGFGVVLFECPQEAKAKTAIAIPIAKIRERVRMSRTNGFTLI